MLKLTRDTKHRAASLRQQSYLSSPGSADSQIRGTDFHTKASNETWSLGWVKWRTNADFRSPNCYISATEQLVDVVVVISATRLTQRAPRCLQSHDVAGHDPSDASHELNALLLWLGRGQRTAHRRPVNDQTRIALTSFIRAPSNVITKSSVPPHWWVAAVTCCTMSKLDGNSQKRRESESSGS